MASKAKKKGCLSSLNCCGGGTINEPEFFLSTYKPKLQLPSFIIDMEKQCNKPKANIEEMEKPAMIVPVPIMEMEDLDPN